MNRNLPELLAVARRDAPADLLLTGASIVNVFSGEIERADIAIAGARIAGIGLGYGAKQTIDLAGSYIAPGLIDAHVHIESSLCTPGEFARAIVPRGVTTVVADPHEIANVAGTAGVRYMIEASRGLAVSVKFMLPSCVPATSMSTAGAALTADDLLTLAREFPDEVIGLAEVMNFPGVIQGDAAMLEKIGAFVGRPVDGHAPGVTAAALNAYIAAGVGSDHECVSVEEASEKLSRGLYVLIREATNAQNLQALLPLVNPRNNRRICLCTDDRQPADLLAEGGIDHMLRTAIGAGVDPVDAFRLAALNPAEWFSLHDRGAIAPGRRADLMVFDDLSSPTARLVLSAGRVVARDGQMTISVPAAGAAQVASPAKVRWDELSLCIKAKSGRVRVIVASEGQLVTAALVCDVPVRQGFAHADAANDLLKIAVIERHRGTGKVGLGFIKGFGLKRGAIAGTVAHDHHNLVVIGVDDESMQTAARAVGAGGLAVTDGTRVLEALPLPVAGLISDRPIEQVRDRYAACLAAARTLGATMHDPLMAMSFMALEVIPSLKLTDQGLVDVEKFRIVDLFV